MSYSGYKCLCTNMRTKDEHPSTYEKTGRGSISPALRRWGFLTASLEETLELQVQQEALPQRNKE